MSLQYSLCLFRQNWGHAPVAAPNGQTEPNPPRCQMTSNVFQLCWLAAFSESASSKLQLSLDIFSLGDILEPRKEPLTLITVTAEEREYSSQCLPTAVSQFLSHKYSDVGILGEAGPEATQQAVAIARDRCCHVATGEAITDAAYRDATLCESL